MAPTTGGDGKPSGNDTKKNSIPRTHRRGVGGFKGAATSDNPLHGLLITSGPNQSTQILALVQALPYLIAQLKIPHLDKCLRENTTRDRDSFMPTRVNKSTYGTTTAGVFTFTDSDREDDYIIDKKIWESEMTTALKAHSKFIDNGEAIFLAIK